MLAYFVIGLLYNLTEAALFRMGYPVWIVFLLSATVVPTGEPMEQTADDVQSVLPRPYH